jgi:hypothetical protein
VSSSILPPFQCVVVFVFTLVGSRHYTVYSCQRESKRETQMSSSLPPFQVAVGLSLSSNFSHYMWAARTTVYFTKENRTGKPKCHLPFFPLFIEWLFLSLLLWVVDIMSTVYSCQRESNRETQMSSSFLPFKYVGLFILFIQLLTHAGQALPGYFTKENRRGKPKCHLPFFIFK